MTFFRDISGNFFRKCSYRTLGQRWLPPKPNCVNMPHPATLKCIRFTIYCGTDNEVNSYVSTPLGHGVAVCNVRQQTAPNWVDVFTALHGMHRGLAMRIPSVCPSVRQTRELWQNGRKICLDFYMVRKIIYPSFLRRSMVGGGRPLLPEIFGQPARVGAKSRNLDR